MGFWVSLWKWVFIISVGAFSLMSIWVAIQGAFDIRSLLKTLREEHAARKDSSQDI